jgi:Ca-activated chloride channel family protein
MNIDANDPKWTAYALGEITDARELTEMEAVLRQSPEIAAIVEDIRETAGWLKEELAAEPTERLTPAQRERIEAKASKPSGFLFGWKPAWTYALATVAVVVIAFIAVRPFLQTDVSQNDPTLITEVFTENDNAKKSKQPLVPQVLTETNAVSKGDDTQKTVNDRIQYGDPEAKISGKVMSASKEALIGATITATDAKTGIQTSVKTDTAGIYNFPDLSHGTYTVEASAPGFTKSAVTDFSVGPENNNLPFEMNSTLYAAAEYEIAREILGTTRPPPPPPPTMAASPQRTVVGGDPTQFIVSETIPMGISLHAPDTDMANVPNQRRGGNFNTEDYDSIRDNPFLNVMQNPLSTFSIDVDTASYSNMRRFLNSGGLPPKDSVRIEELVNYFDYDYKAPRDGKPFAANVEMTEAPWNPKNRLLRIGLKGRVIDKGKRPESNLVFLIDVSGSMSDQNKLPLVKESMKMLVDRLTESDRVAIVVYAGDTRLLLPSTRGDQKTTLRNAIDGLRAGGSTAGASGIQLAYEAAQKNFVKGGVNRIILATDGDFNVSITNRGDLTRKKKKKAKSGIFLSALGFGMGNYKDTTLELLADKGRGNYAYIDTENEARKVLVEQMNSTLVAIAKDVKIQVEFNPTRVGSYRLLGYENRIMAKEDFNNDAKMAGVIGAGHTVTAFYELELAGTETSAAKPGVDPLRYQQPPQASASADSRELATVKIRSKEPEKEESVLTEYVVNDNAGRFASASGDFKFASAVAAFGMMLRDSPHKGNADFERILEWAKSGKGEDRYGHREEFIRLVHRAASIPRR